MDWPSDVDVGDDEAELTSSCCEGSVYSIRVACTAQVLRPSPPVELAPAAQQQSFIGAIIPSPVLPSRSLSPSLLPSAASSSSHYSRSSSSSSSSPIENPQQEPSSSQASVYQPSEAGITTNNLRRGNSLSETDTYTNNSSSAYAASSSVDVDDRHSVSEDIWAASQQQQQQQQGGVRRPPPPHPRPQQYARRRTEGTTSSSVLADLLPPPPPPLLAGFMAESRGRRASFPLALHDRGWVTTGDGRRRRARATIYRDGEGNIVRVEESEGEGGQGVRGRAKGLVKRAWGAVRDYYFVRERGEERGMGRRRG